MTTYLRAKFFDLNSKITLSIWHFHLLIINTLFSNLVLIMLEKKTYHLVRVFNQPINKMKEECKGIAQGLIENLQSHFLPHEVMIAMGVVYPQFWATNGKEVEENFHNHLAILKPTFCVHCKMRESGNIMPHFLSSQTFDLQTSFSK